MDSNTQRQEILADYIADMRELLDTTERLLMNAEQHFAGAGIGKDLLNEIFRSFHTIKGTSGFLELTTIVRVAHQAEALLDHARSGVLKFEREMGDELMAVCDMIRRLIDVVEETGSDKGHEDAADSIVAKLKGLLPENLAPAPEKNQKWGLFEPLPPPPVVSSITSEMLSHFKTSAGERIQNVLIELKNWPENPDGAAETSLNILTGLAENCALLEFPAMNRLFTACSALLASPAAAAGEITIPVSAALEKALSDLESLPGEDRFADAAAQMEKRIAAEHGGGHAAVHDVKQDVTQDPAHDPHEAAANAWPEESGQHAERQDIRIATSKLDIMMNLVGELVIAESLVTHHKDLQGIVSADYFATARQLEKIVRHMQEVALSMRMVPLTTVFQRMTRLTRDLSRKSGKLAVLHIEGEETEVDKTIAERIADPLVHIMRNCVDHGLETPEERRAAGKDETGSIMLRAGQSGGEVHISVQDDGHGLNRKKILARAREKGLIDGSGDDMPDEAVWELIFLPGFTTAEKVTDISGRGVGMDVVRKNVALLNGRVDVRSQPSKGTQFVLRIPLTLAIIEGLVARIGSVHFAIPTTDIFKSIQYSSLNFTTLDRGDRAAEINGQFFPVITLGDLLNMPGAHETIDEKSIVVQVGQGAKSVGIIVDELLGNQSIVVKPLTGLVKNSQGVSGCTILGDGSVALIVDVGYLVNMISYGTAKNQDVSDSRARIAI